ncbi:hypothetical protein I4U23_002077 [Adineta vaga]|nr:hypothetical protein I4U23_002077 [Adineta vaga]
MTESTSTEQSKPSTSSWFSNFDLTNQLTNLSSSIVQATTKVGAVANTIVQKSLPQRPSTPNENEEPNTESNKDLTSILTDFSSSVIKSAQQLKQAVEQKTILGHFTKEHEKFLTEKRTQQRREESAVPPWVGYKEEEEMKKQILALSQEQRIFLRDPPPGANYHFDMITAYPIALATLEVDENLKKMRFELVPKKITEESFWCNYFYRVSLIKQSTQLNALANENTNSQAINEADTSSTHADRRTSELNDKMFDGNQDFVSEDYDTTDINMDDIRREIEQLSITKKNSTKTKSSSPDLDEREWVKALDDELENVSTEQLENVSAEELEAQINEVLSAVTIRDNDLAKVNMGISPSELNDDEEKQTNAKRRRTDKRNTPMTHIEYDSLQEYGYHFKNDKLVSIESNEPFKFDVFDDKEENQKRYETIGKLIDNAVFDLLESTCKLQRVTVPIDAKRNEKTSFIFVSNDLSTAKYLMIIIHGTGVVRAGQWSRKLIINEGLEIGSQMEYIRRARAAGYAVIVTNTNLNDFQSSRSLRRHSTHPIRGSSSAEEHGCYVWEHFVRPSPAKHICIMAHSYGGAVVLEMARQFLKEFEQYVFAIALTDSPMTVYGRRVKKNVLQMLKQKTINWVTDTEKTDTVIGESDCCQLRSAGHTIHEWTSHTAIDAIFKYFAAKRQKLEQN